MNVADLVALEQARAARRAALKPDRGTTAHRPSMVKGTVTAATAGSVACEVDGLPATNGTGWNLTVGEHVWLDVMPGVRLVKLVGEIKEP